MENFNISDFEGEQPQAFYLLGIQEDMEALCDATLVVEGCHLPVHSPVRSYVPAALQGRSSSMWLCLGRQAV